MHFSSLTINSLYANNPGNRFQRLVALDGTREVGLDDHPVYSFPNNMYKVDRMSKALSPVKHFLACEGRVAMAEIGRRSPGGLE
jgi:hypothetical protein